MNKPHPKQCEIVRIKSDGIGRSYDPDGGRCPACNHPTVIADDASRRYCSYSKCNALITGWEDDLK